MLIVYLTSILIAAAPIMVPADESNPRLKLIERNVFDVSLEPDLRKILVNDLTDIGTEAAQSILVRAIQSAEESVALSTLEAIAEMNDPPRGVIEPIVERWLRNGDSTLATPLLSALTRYGSDSVTILEAACNVERPLEQRRRAVQALSVFAGGEGARVLIALANSEDHEDIRLEVFDGLRSLWSRLAPNRPITTNLGNPQAWIPILTPNGSECRLENERRVEAEEERERFAASLMQSRATIYNLLPEAERASQLREDLSSGVPPIRRAAMIRIDERLQDGISPSDPITSALMTALDDSDEANKILAASVLSKVNPQSTAIAIADRLEMQRTSVIQQWGVHLIRNPVEEAALPALGLLRNQVGSEEVGVGVLLALDRTTSLRDLFNVQQRSSLQDWLDRYLANGAPSPEAMKLRARMSGEKFRESLRQQLRSPDEKRSLHAAWGLAELGAVSELSPRSDAVFQVEPWLTACLNHSPSGGFVDQAFVVDLLDVEQINQLVSLKLKPKWELAVVHLARRTNPNQLYKTDLLLEQVLGMEAARVRRELFDQEHWDSWILPRLTDDPTARDLSIRSAARALARVGRSTEAKALADNFMNSAAAKNDVLLELALRQSYWNTAESQESKSNWVRVLGSCDTIDQQVRPALVELAKTMAINNDGLDVGPVVDHLDATVSLILVQDDVQLSELEVWQPIVDRLPNETQVRWAERLAAMTPVPIEDSTREEATESQSAAADSETNAPRDPESSAVPTEPSSPVDPER